jgi:hypothetical protein
MMHKLLFVVALFVFNVFNFAHAQFNYERGVEPVVNAGWHQIQIPNTVLAKLNDGFRDIRLFSANGQEIPYLLRTALDDVVFRFSLSTFQNKGVICISLLR